MLQAPASQPHLGIVEEECAVISIKDGDCVHEMNGVGCEPRISKLENGAR